MIAIRTVVCPVDFTAATQRQLQLAVDACRAFKARLVLHHNVTDLSVGAGVGWMWHADQVRPAASADDCMRDLVSQVPQGIEVETCLTRGAIAEGVLRVSEAAEADLIVLSAHKGKTEDHASVIEYLLECSNRAVLALHDAGGDLKRPAFRLDDGQQHAMQSVLVPVNVSHAAHPQVDYACDLARVLPIRLHLLHVVPSHLKSGDIDATTVMSRLQQVVPDDLRDRTSVHVESGDPVPVIARAARAWGVACVVMGEHTRIPIKRWFSHDTSRAVLHEAPCPVWYVPSAMAPASHPLSRFALSDEKSILWGNV